MAPTKLLKSFKPLSCPFCGNAEEPIRINLLDLTSITCSACDEEFTPKQARDRAAEQLARWEAICRWVELAGECLAE